MSIYDFKAITMDGKEASLEQYRGKVLVIVDMERQSGVTPQYEGLETLYEQYKDEDFEIIGYPTNKGDFKSFELDPPNEKKFNEFLKESYQESLEENLVENNFTKFLIDCNGNIVKRYESSTESADMALDIDNLIDELKKNHIPVTEEHGDEENNKKTYIEKTYINERSDEALNIGGKPIDTVLSNSKMQNM
ncbi:redoxin domain-containing protein [Clostridium bowmanii]|uniref:redoxin domain-containing protein n=1 Tax=Clostridium bowmanii TaxID=132925 RepID=UPI001C0C67C5|nr:redoxin domain-containing protein [Clostridium bowmanii]MBU3192222.1 redoxin domain-containing protein [Clostridium bowmanii]MCA1076437.1 redoxin domain-containing protein [Clostridium bowmanii]